MVEIKKSDRAIVVDFQQNTNFRICSEILVEIGVIGNRDKLS